MVDVLIRIVELVGDLLDLVFKVNCGSQTGRKLSVLYFSENRLICDCKRDKNDSVGNQFLSLYVSNSHLIVDCVSRTVEGLINSDVDLNGIGWFLDHDDFTLGLSPIHHHVCVNVINYYARRICSIECNEMLRHLVQVDSQQATIGNSHIRLQVNGVVRHGLVELQCFLIQYNLFELKLKDVFVRLD